MKYSVMFSCGHAEEVQIYGKAEERERKIKYFGKSGLCPECYKKKMNEEKTEKEAEEVTEISLDDFEKVRLQVGEIVACEKVEKSSKLLHETVKFGDETRSVVSGIAKHFKPEELIGKKVVFVTNLKPVKLCGVLSEGMILAAEDADGKFSLICPESDVNDGTRLG